MFQANFFEIGNDLNKWLFPKEFLEPHDPLSIGLLSEDNGGEGFQIEDDPLAIAKKMLQMPIVHLLFRVAVQ